LIVDSRIAEAIDRLEQFMATAEDALAIPRSAAEFVHALVVARGAGPALEIGTSYGYSGLWIAAALSRTGGRLITIDHLQRKSDAARANIAAAGLDHLVEFWTGTALDLLPRVAGPIDFVLNDADKENCIAYVEMLIPKLARRAVVLTDNTSTHPVELAPFLAWIRQRTDFVTATVPIGNGMELSVRL
jgi:predicted O-methyltransferase YrrM